MPRIPYPAYSLSVFADQANHFFDRQRFLLAVGHIFERHRPVAHFVSADQCHVRHVSGVGITHLLLHFHAIRKDLRRDARRARLARQLQAVVGFSFAKVDEEQAHTLLDRSGIKIKLVQDVINAVRTKTNAHAA